MMGSLDPQIQSLAQRMAPVLAPLIAQRMYEGGDWTPTFGGTTTNGTVSYTIQVGRYVRIGALVHAFVSLQANVVTAAPTGTLTINGLPFTSDSTANLFGGSGLSFHRFLTLPAGSIDVTALVRPATTRAELIGSQGAAAAAGLNAASLVSGGGVFGAIVYLASA